MGIALYLGSGHLKRPLQSWCVWWVGCPKWVGWELLALAYTSGFEMLQSVRLIPPFLHSR